VNKQVANLMITKRCNLQCTYCFANEFVKPESNDFMTMNTFQKLVEFILADGSENSIGLIGGEPTLHPLFAEMLELVLNDARMKDVTIYTNGILLEKYRETLNDKKVHILINCNDLSNSNKNTIERFQQSLSSVCETMKDRVVLGLNYYKPGLDYKFILDLLTKYKMKNLRLSITVPNGEYSYEPLAYFKTIKQDILHLFDDLYEINVVPHLDCNIFPACLVEIEDVERYPNWGVQNPFSIVKNRFTICKPVIDFLPDKTVVRCFGLSECTKVKYNQFASITDLKCYYLKEFDAYAINSYYDVQCSTCYKYRTMKCSGGCLVYKIDKILKLKEKQKEVLD